jgi:hypothetical protein
MRLKWKLVSVHLEIVLILTQDRCTVYAEHTIGLEIIFARTRWKLNVILVRLETVLVYVQDRCTGLANVP